MIKRLTIALVCVVASLAVLGVATADARTLSFRHARTLAERLAEKQVRGRGVISFHLLKGKRVSSRRIDFAYDDRTTDNVFCTAVVVVTSRDRGNRTFLRAHFAGQRCNGIPTEVLEFEALTRQAQRDLRANTAATLDALNAVSRSAKRCRNVHVPRRAVAGARVLFDIATIEALQRPNDPILGTFVAALVDVQAKDAILAAGAQGWADYLGIVRLLPAVSDPCAALKAWKLHGFSAGSAPIDFAGFRTLDKRATVARKAINRAAALMAVDGAFPNAALGFTPDGLLLQLSARAGVTGGVKKLVLG